ncbi:MAG: MFS transporter, partial [Lachnospiraceae bacterium]|nr:MFS transporter [Lachnospiraceae bacterium]
MDNKVTNHVKRNVKLDYISTFITNLNMQSSIWVLYLAYCGLSLAQIGLVEGIYHATSILFEIPSGALADLLGRKRCMILSRICIAISCMIMLFAIGFWFFALSFVIQALGNNLNSGSEEALVYDSMKYTGQEDQYI